MQGEERGGDLPSLNQWEKRYGDPIGGQISVWGAGRPCLYNKEKQLIKHLLYMPRIGM